MNAKAILIGASAALALAFSPAYAADKNAKTKDNDPGFNALDKDNDGYLSRAEAAGNPELAKKFAEVDKDKDGKLSRSEYLSVMAVKDARTVKDKTVNAAKNVKEEVKRGGDSSTGSSAPATTDKPANPKP